MRGLAAFVLTVFAVLPAAASTTDSDALRRLLDEFLAGATIGDVATHERFWADDLVYTSSNGTRTGKAQIVEGMRASQSGPTAMAPPVAFASLP